MKKIIKKLKNNIFLIIGVAIGMSISGVAVYAASTYDSNTVAYTKNSQSTVQGALNTLFTRIPDYKQLQCPGCVYRYSATRKYNSNSSGANGTNNKLSSNEYTTDYTTLNRNVFLGHIIDSSGYILSSYACGINNGNFFCLRGVDSSQSSLTYNPFYQEASNRMHIAFSGCTSSNYCYQGIYAQIETNGHFKVDTLSGKNCDVYSDGSSYCK